MKFYRVCLEKNATLNCFRNEPIYWSYGYIHFPCHSTVLLTCKYSFWVWRTFTEGIEGWICSPDYLFIQTLAQFHGIKKIWTVKCFFRLFYSSFPLKKASPAPKSAYKGSRHNIDTFKNVLSLKIQKNLVLRPSLCINI